MIGAALALVLCAAPAPRSLLGPAATYELAVYWLGKAPPEHELEKLVAGTRITLVDADMEKYGPPSEEVLQYFGRGLSAAQVAEVQKASSATRFVVLVPADQALATYRKVIAAVGTAATRWKGYPWDEATHELFTVEEWQKRRIDEWDGDLPVVPRQIVIHKYDDGGAIRMVTLGMQKFALPDIAVDDVTETFAKPMNMLINMIADELLARPELNANGELLIEKVPVRLEPAKRHEGDAPNALYTIVFPGTGSRGARIAGLLEKTLGKPDDKITMRPHRELEAARALARARLPEIKRRFPQLRSALETLIVKGPFVRSGQTEYMWIEVQRWEADTLTGVLNNDPGHVKDLKRGDRVSVKEDQVFDWMIYLRDGGTEGGETVLDPSRR